jgi:hypothetical protein
MRNLVVRLIDGEKVLEEKTVTGDEGWMERYRGVVQDYTAAMMTNDNLTIRINTVYDKI